MNPPAFSLLSYNPGGAFLPRHGISAAELEQFGESLEDARRQVLADLELFHGGGDVPQEKQPLDAGFMDLPERLLAEYARSGETSEIGRMLAAARRIAERVDRVAVLGIGGSYMGARALMEAALHPYHNELGRDERGGRPRMYFEGNNVDNDASRGLLELLGGGRPAESETGRWAIVVISKSGGTLETAVAFRQFFRALVSSCGGDEAKAAELVVPVTGGSGKLFDLAQSIGCRETFPVPDGVGGRFSILSAVGLLPAAILGIDIVALLRGAAAMNEHFKSAPPGRNAVLDYAGVCRLLETERGASIRVLSVWAKALEAAGLWYDQLLAESLGKQEQGAAPITAVNTRDLHSRAQQHQEGRRDKLITNVIVDHWRTDPLSVGRSGHDADGLNELAEKTLPELMEAAIAGTNQAYREDGRPTADIHLPDTSAASLGQLFQMLMLATVVEGRLMGVNPYGQPGVEMYKRFMNQRLGRG